MAGYDKINERAAVAEQYQEFGWGEVIGPLVFLGLIVWLLS
jgi:hypothetical protein